MEADMHPRKAFIIQVVTVVHTCHSHNITAARKRLETATRLFLATCRFDGLFDSLIQETVATIGDKLYELRYVDPNDEAETTRVKSDCLVVVRKLHDMAKRTVVRDGVSMDLSELDEFASPAPVEEPAPVENTRSTGMSGFGFFRKSA